jgi:hypothetical protein
MYEIALNRSKLVENKFIKNFTLAEPVTQLDDLQKLFDNLPRATKVDIDLRTETYLFDSGFVRKGGSNSWRNFNLLDLKYNDETISWGSISPDKSKPEWLAVFPNDTIGNTACINYLDTYWNDKSLDEIVQNFLVNNADSNLELFWKQHDYWDSDMLWNDFKIMFPEELINFIFEIALVNGFKYGKAWIKYRNVPDDADIKVNDPGISLLTTNGNIIESWVGEDPNLEQLITAGSGVAEKIRKINNDAVLERQPHYTEALKLDTKAQYNLHAMDILNDLRNNSIASLVPTINDMVIPCTCDNMMCMLLNYIVQYMQETFNKLLDEIINKITDFLIPDWVKDLMKMVNDFMQCLNSLFGIVTKMLNINDAKNMLLDDMRDRIAYYPSDPCFMPPETGVPEDFTIVDERGDPLPGDIYPNPDDPITDDWDLPHPGKVLIPTEPDLPIIVTPGIDPVPGIPGRNISGFLFNCDYLEY